MYFTYGKYLFLKGQLFLNKFLLCLRTYDGLIFNYVGLIKFANCEKMHVLNYYLYIMYVGEILQKLVECLLLIYI